MGAAAERIPASELMAQVPRLVSLPGEPVREYRLLNKRVLIGSGGEADFVLLDQTVSRKHAQVIKRHGAYLLVDLGSAHGTFLNRRKLTPNTEYPLSSACDVQIGTLHFTFLLPEGSQDALRGALNRRMRTEGLVTVLLLVSIVLSYIVPKSFWDGLLPHRTTRITPVVLDDTWLSSLNHFREAAGLPPVSDDKALSTGVGNHAHYVVANDAAMIRAGKVDASIHEEDSAKPYFSAEGKAAGSLSDVDAVFTDPPVTPEPSWAIENWITGPFHRMWLLNPALHAVGYGQYCSGGICAAALNVRSGMDADPGRAAPVMYPSDRDTIRNGKFSAEESEWPDPLATCGYHTPTGVPISLQIGGSAPAGLESFSLTRNGTAVESCAFDASSYKSADPVAQDRVRKELAHFAAIVMVPREPLVPGATYSVNIKAGGQSFSWWFAVEP
jgi:hypothetical protein